MLQVEAQEADLGAMTKQEVVEQLCKLMWRAYATIDPGAREPCDCVCRDTGMAYQNAGHALTFLEEAVSEAIAKRERSVKRKKR